MEKRGRLVDDLTDLGEAPVPPKIGIPIIVAILTLAYFAYAMCLVEQGHGQYKNALLLLFVFWALHFNLMSILGSMIHTKNVPHPLVLKYLIPGFMIAGLLMSLFFLGWLSWRGALTWSLLWEAVDRFIGWFAWF